MYTDEDLEKAVEKGIFTDVAVKEFRSFIYERNNTQLEDEENVRLAGSFNDVFVVIACVLLLVSSGWVTYRINPALGMGVVSLLSWGLAEFFVLKRKMALPAIVLLISFVASLFAFIVLLFQDPSQTILMLAAAVSSVGVWFHWKRFQVPITIAAGAATGVIFVTSLVIAIFPQLDAYVLYFMLLGGVITFFIAMRWDSKDLKRITGKSDVAFWLHLVSAPLIVHPVFSILGILDGNDSMSSMFIIILLYLFLTVVSVAIDRRAFMVSALVYVLVALTGFLESYGLAGDSFAIVGVVMGFSLLLLSGFWHKARAILVNQLPEYIQGRVPAVL